MHSVVTRIFRVMVIVMLASGCQRTQLLGRLDLSDQDNTEFVFSIESRNWPSRVVMFEPLGQGNEGLPAYSEPIYKSTMRVSVSNVGTSSFHCSLGAGKENLVATMERHDFDAVEFRQFQLKIVPSDQTIAKVKIEITFNQHYSTRGSWKLAAKWSDGP